MHWRGKQPVKHEPPLANDTPADTTQKKNAAETDAPTLKIIPLGGCGQFGLNCTCVQCGDELLVVDCGMMLPGHDMPGVDVVFPDLTYLSLHREKIKGYLLTHGHEDHMGAIPFALELAPAPVFGTPFTLGMLQNRLDDHVVPVQADARPIQRGKRLELCESFTVEPIAVAHSIPGSVAYAFETPAGCAVITGDYKMKATDAGSDRSTDTQRLQELGEGGVDLLLGDSTNALVPGLAGTEDDVFECLAQTFATSPGGIFVSLFSTHVARIQTLCNLSRRFNRKIAVDGRSLQKVVDLAKKLNLLDLPHHQLVPVNSIENIPRKNLTVLLTGSQGEPRSALTRLAMEAHSNLSLNPGDTVVLSARVIPGREKQVDRLVDRLYRQGAAVVDNRFGDTVHVSGHGHKEDLSRMIQLLRPRAVLPIHGRYRMQMEHANIARRGGTDQVKIPDNGTIIRLTKDGLQIEGNSPVGHVLVDGKSVGDVEMPVLRARRALAHMGMVVAVALLDVDNKKLARPLELISRGFIAESNGEELLEKVRAEVERDIQSLAPQARTDSSEVAETIRLRIRRFLRKELHRAPVVIPLVIET